MSAFSASWYRVSALRPKLHDHVEVHRHPYGDELAYVLQDHATGRLHRFNAAAYDIIGRMNGQRALQEIWDAAVAALGDDAPTQDEVVGLLGRLHRIDALQGGVTPDTAELFQRALRERKGRWKQRLRSPLSLRVPLFDPDRLLTALLPAFGPLFSSAGLIVWCLVVSLAAILAGAHWDALVHAAREEALQPANLVLLACVYPVLKGLHELGHGITTKKWGGEVHELGITFLVFVPIPYIDASSSAVIRARHRRMAVGAAGMMVELLAASLALLVWLALEPGPVRSAAFNVMLIGGVTTVLFNGNPLLRFDAYYMLEDAVEVPNLASRANRYLGYLLQRYVFGVRDAVSPLTREAERFWFLLYGLGSTPYRIFITVTIVWFVAGEFFVLGMVLAVWAAATQLLWPLAKQWHFLLFDVRLRERRIRAVALSGGVVAAVLSVLLFYPAPSATQAQGVLTAPERSKLLVRTEGFVRRVLVEPLAKVRAGDPLLELEDPLLEARIAVLQAELEELEARARIELRVDLTQAAVLDEQVRAKRAELARELERAAGLAVAAPVDGVYAPLDFADPTGTYVRKGASLGYVLGEDRASVRVVVAQERIGLLRESVRSIGVRLAERIDTVVPAAVNQTTPQADTQLPSRILGIGGGGDIAVDSSDERGETARSPVFHYELALLEPPSGWRIGERAYVRFDHGREPLARQWYRWGRQLFLGRFGV